MVLPRPHTRAYLTEAAGDSAPTAKQLPAYCGDIPLAFPQGPKSIRPSRQARGKQHRFQSDWKPRWILFPEKAPFRVYGEPLARIELRAFDSSLFRWFSLSSENIDFSEHCNEFGGWLECYLFGNGVLSKIRISVPGKITSSDIESTDNAPSLVSLLSRRFQPQVRDSFRKCARRGRSTFARKAPANSPGQSGVEHVLDGEFEL